MVPSVHLGNEINQSASRESAAHIKVYTIIKKLVWSCASLRHGRSILPIVEQKMVARDRPPRAARAHLPISHRSMIDRDVEIAAKSARSELQRRRRESRIVLAGSRRKTRRAISFNTRLSGIVTFLVTESDRSSSNKLSLRSAQAEKISRKTIWVDYLNMESDRPNAGSGMPTRRRSSAIRSSNCGRSRLLSGPLSAQSRRSRPAISASTASIYIGRPIRGFS
jgi:hypothetical protein